ncbi:gpi-anchored wall transfer protein 1 [Ceraceosorus bombacis]|uniref:GPI-anchored wall transfer protein n=1 Tax=Ceraceosorus bombacis TaxID=401625 RepID=A0A0P1BCK6_9BASI|nr:gpi-anchored wall transfer protein 1 [Ceraceosorus bombacis]
MGLASDEYRTLKESSVTGLTGSSLTRINLISLTALTTYALWAALRLKRPRLLDSVLLQFALLVLPLLLSCTLFSSAAASSLFNAALSLACLGVLRLRAQVSAVARDASSAKVRAAHLAEPMRISIDSAGDAAHAAANAPTRYEYPDNVHRNDKGKRAESQALGLAFLDDDPTARRTSMDLGVGSFVFSLGLINAAPLLRAQTRYEPVRASLLREVRKAVPLLLLGGARVVAVKGSHYQEHLSEYGVHWNFFITLALLPPLATILRPLARQRNARWSVIGIGIGIAYEILLRLTRLQSYVLGPGPRISLFSANKEGIISLAGYLALYLIGLDVGHYVLPLDPYYAYRRASVSRNKPKYEKLCEVLASLSLLFWMAYGLLALVSPAERVASRRLANLPYVIWVSAFNVSFLLGYVAIFLALVEWPASTANRAADDASTRQRLRASRRKARDNSSDEDSMEEEAEDALRGLER